MSLKLPGWLTRGGVPPISGLDPHEAEELLRAAARSGPNSNPTPPYMLNCARVDMSEWLWEVIERWAFRGVSEQMMSRLFGWVAADDDVARLAETLGKPDLWSDSVGGSVAARRRGLSMLGAVDSPLARLELLRFLDSTRNDDLLRAARETISDACAEEGATREHYADSAAPLDVLSGVRRRLVASEVLRRGEWRLERAMVVRRRWSIARWRTLWRDHTLLAPVAQRVVWVGRIVSDHVAFLFTDDGGIIDSATDDESLVGMSEVWVAHPSEIDLLQWSETLTSLEVVQPFDQISRAARGYKTLASLVGESLDSEVLAQAERWGWVRRARRVGKVRDLLVLRVGELSTTVRLSPGLTVTSAGRVLRRQQRQAVASISVRDTVRGVELTFDEWPDLQRIEIALLVGRAALQVSG